MKRIYDINVEFVASENQANELFDAVCELVEIYDGWEVTVMMNDGRPHFKYPDVEDDDV